MIEKGEIKDIQLYNKLMQFGMDDKLFFVKSLEDCDILIDFGCADGSQILALSELRPDIKYVGYDNDVQMINLAKEKLIDYPNVVLTNDWNDVLYEITQYKSAGINLSSVIHEVISYGDNNDFDDFLNKVFNGDFKHIFVRDMMITKSTSKLIVSDEDYFKLKNSDYSDLLDSFEEHWGSVKDNYVNFLHFLHKYRYGHNWHTENLENYFPIFVGDFLYKIPETFYLETLDKYKYEYTNNRIKEDFDIETDENATTHVKIIIRRND